VQRVVLEDDPTSAPAADQLADQVFDLLRWRLAAERDRTFG
jgi:hypothetical protein